MWRLFIRRDVIGLVYHIVSAEAPPHVRNLYPCKSPSEFEADLLYLKENFQFVSYAQTVEAREGKENTKPNSILVTVDDGFSECRTEIAPILKRHGVPAVFFVATDFLDNKALSYRATVSLCIEKAKTLPPAEFKAVRRQLLALSSDQTDVVNDACALFGVDVEDYLARQKPFLTSDDVRSLSRDGFVIGAHSKSHPNFGRLHQDEMEKEIVQSCEIVRQITGQTDVPFAFPFDGAGIDREFLRNLRNTHPFVGLLFDTHGFRRDAPFVVNRIWVDKPAGSCHHTSNLPTFLNRAHRRYLLWRIWCFCGALRPASRRWI